MNWWCFTIRHWESVIRAIFVLAIIFMNAQLLNENYGTKRIDNISYKIIGFIDMPLYQIRVILMK